jgi:hypothetical protein
MMNQRPSRLVRDNTDEYLRATIWGTEPQTLPHNPNPNPELELRRFVTDIEFSVQGRVIVVAGGS